MLKSTNNRTEQYGPIQYTCVTVCRETVKLDKSYIHVKSAFQIRFRNVSGTVVTTILFIRSGFFHGCTVFYSNIRLYRVAPKKLATIKLPKKSY